MERKLFNRKIYAQLEDWKTNLSDRYALLNKINLSLN